jgi:hypothetical protein
MSRGGLDASKLSSDSSVLTLFRDAVAAEEPVAWRYGTVDDCLIDPHQCYGRVFGCL